MYSLTRSSVIRAAIAAVALLLGACAVQPSARLPALEDWDSRQRVLASLPSWQVSGRIAVSDGNDGFNGNLRWQQTRGGFDARLSGPLGAGAIQIKGTERQITVVEKDGTVTELHNPEYDLRARFGWAIPVSSLRYWVLGIPDPSLAANPDFGADGLLTRMEQGGWIVTIGAYGEGGGQAMPRRISAVNADNRVRLVIDRWIFH